MSAALRVVQLLPRSQGASRYAMPTTWAHMRHLEVPDTALTAEASPREGPGKLCISQIGIGAGLHPPGVAGFGIGGQHALHILLGDALPATPVGRQKSLAKGGRPNSFVKRQ